MPLTDLRKATVAWSGGHGGPGISTFYFTETTVSYPLFVNLWSVLRGNCPTGITWTIAGGGDTINPLTGELTGVWGGPTPNIIACNGGGMYADAAGAMIRWDTGTVADGHRVKGRTFLVPLVDSLYGSGVLDSAWQTTVNTQ